MNCKEKNQFPLKSILTLTAALLLLIVAPQAARAQDNTPTEASATATQSFDEFKAAVSDTMKADASDDKAATSSEATRGYRTVGKPKIFTRFSVEELVRGIAPSLVGGRTNLPARSLDQKKDAPVPATGIARRFTTTMNFNRSDVSSLVLVYRY